jgi:hypothetical protein
MTQLYKKGFLKEVDGNEPINLMNKAKEMEVMGKEMSYADGYAEGYKRALEYMYQVIYTQIKIKE